VGGLPWWGVVGGDSIFFVFLFFFFFFFLFFVCGGGGGGGGAGTSVGVCRVKDVCNKLAAIRETKRKFCALQNSYLTLTLYEINKLLKPSGHLCTVQWSLYVPPV